MRIRSLFRTLTLLVAFFVLTAASAVAGEQAAGSHKSHSQTPSTDSCRTFVQEFYNWYISGPQPKGNITKLEYALAHKSALFTPVLRQKLQADLQASAKVSDEIVGLDFDPVLNAQDDPGRMIAGKVTMKGANCLVDVSRSPRSEGDRRKADVQPELALDNGHWVFVNFHYPPNETPGDNDLLSILKNLAADRAKQK